MSNYTGSGILIATDSDQEKTGLYKVTKTVDANKTLTMLNSARAMKDFKVVSFLSCKDLKKAEDLANHFLELKDIFKGYNKSVFVRTVLTIIEKKKGFKFSEFIYKVKLRPTSLVLCGDKKSYSALIEDIYNYKRRESEKLNLRLQ